MQQFLYQIHPIRPDIFSAGFTDEEQRIFDEHFEYLKNLVNQGVVFLAGRTLKK